MRISLAFALVCAVVLCQCESTGRQEVPEDGSSSAKTQYAAGKIPPSSKVVETVRFTTSDGVQIAASWYAAAAKGPAVLCLHQWRSDRTRFSGLAAMLQKEGFSVLAIDMRGHGGSVKNVDGTSVAPDRNAQPELAAALTFLRSRPTVDAARLGIIGASYGSSNAIMTAAAEAGVKAVVMLSPGMNFFNVLPIEDAVKKFRGAVLAVASDEDVRSADAVKKIALIGGARVDTKSYKDAGHGTDILEAGLGLDEVVVAFLKRNL